MEKIFKNLFLVIIIIALLCLTGCKDKKVENEVKETKIEESKHENVTPLFYKISSNETDSTIYLLGSIHAADDSIYPLNDKIMDSYKASDYLAVEVNILDLNNDFKFQMELIRKMIYEDGTTIKDHLGEEVYNKMVESLKRKELYNPYLDIYKPTFFISLFESQIMKDAGMDSNKGIDMHFLKLAKKDKKEILEVETIDLQMDLLLNMNDEVSKMMIESYSNYYIFNVLAMKNLYTTWKKGNNRALEKSSMELYEENLSEEEYKILNEYYQKLHIDRNYGMVKVLEEYMAEDKNVFCVVGAAHVVGDEGIANLMEQKGYKVEKVDLKDHS